MRYESIKITTLTTFYLLLQQLLHLLLESHSPSPCYSVFLCWHYLNVHWLCGPRSCARGLYRPDVDVYQKPLNSITSFSHQAHPWLLLYRTDGLQRKRALIFNAQSQKSLTTNQNRINIFLFQFFRITKANFPPFHFFFFTPSFDHAIWRK